MPPDAGRATQEPFLPLPGSTRNAANRPATRTGSWWRAIRIMNVTLPCEFIAFAGDPNETAGFSA